MLMRYAEGRKKEASKAIQINNKAKQHNTPKTVTNLNKNELPHVRVHTGFSLGNTVVGGGSC